MSQVNESSDEQFSHSQQKQLPAPSSRRIDWQSPLIGYLCVLPLLALTVLLTFMTRSVVHHFLVNNTFLMLATSLIASFWGAGPTVLILILGLIFLDFLPSPGSTNLLNWPDIIQVVPFSLGGLLIVALTAQRQRALSALRQHAQELEELNAILRAANQEKNLQMAIAAHELKSPLTTLRLYSQWLQHWEALPHLELTSTRRLTTICQRIEEQTQRLAILTGELLGEQSILAPQSALIPQPCDLVALCSRIVELQCLITQRSITLTVSSPELIVLGFPHQLEQILNNLITNAIKYSPEGCSIEVTLDSRNGIVRLSVFNAGPGIAPDQLPLLFTPYYRTPEAQSSSIAGQGLGLTIVQALVELYHHGHIWCESTLGEGTTFIVELPRIHEQ